MPVLYIDIYKSGCCYAYHNNTHHAWSQKINALHFCQLNGLRPVFIQH